MNHPVSTALRTLVSPAKAVPQRLPHVQKSFIATTSRSWAVRRARIGTLAPQIRPGSALLQPSRFASTSWANQRSFSAESNGSESVLLNKDSESSVAIVGNKVHLQWIGGTTSRFHSFWLRDHCHCPECYHSITKQRLVNTFKIPRDVTPKSVTPTATGIEVIWSNDDHRSHYTYSWLNKHSYDPKIHDPFRPEGEAKITWDNSIASHLPEVAYKDVMNSEQGLAEWLNNIVGYGRSDQCLIGSLHVYGFSYVSGVPVSTEATEELARRIAFIRESHYGGFWDFTSDLGHGDTAYTDIALGVHTDTTYFTDPVGLQMFHLLHHDGEGGHNLLVDGFHCAKILKEKHPNSYKTLSELRIPAHSAGDAATHIVPTPRRNPILNHDPMTNELYQIRFNNDDRSTMDHLSAGQIESFYEALFDWNNILTDDKHLLTTKFQPGRVLIFDNWRCLHGRSAFTGKRRMCGAYTNWDDYRSRWRTLNTPSEQLAEDL
ncbi:hypothetical protein BGZ70_007237 [Mortierella alpina]|uniref:trimethyllysine dioxygenase n=1 Tax=Mortierella alpina TaxID=64518 RepID=A0A9P6J708_MORAP|nr:hypothetical protein BGZ70_007237 [Mortierella alpina]